MQFNSYTFILIFMPLFVLCYFGLSRVKAILGKVVLIVGGAIFYIYAGWDMALIFGISIVLNFLLSLIMAKTEKWKKLVLIMGIIVNVFALLYFKYFNFFVQNINMIAKTTFDTREIVLPLAISFFTFQQIAYLVNKYQGKLNAYTGMDYFAYILYFPKLLMGPIVEPEYLIPQFYDTQRKKISIDNIAAGIKVFSFGLFKKMLLADTFAQAVSWGFTNVEIATSLDLILVMLSYTFQIYFDFSGYSDMGVGISMMLNIDLPMNFDSPYKAISIRDFWKRWHMSLTQFFTKYIYIPLGGSKKGVARTYVNTMIVFLVSGIWHGANWTFILWGILHGAFSVLDRVFEKIENKILHVIRWLATFVIVNVLWLLFASESINQCGYILKRILQFDNMTISNSLSKVFNIPEFNCMITALNLTEMIQKNPSVPLIGCVIVALMLCLLPKNNYRTKSKITYANAVLAAVAFVWGFICLGAESTFVYFGF